MKTKPMRQQQECLDKMDGKRNFAILMEQGLGKTWTLLADAERCFQQKKIEALLILAPNGVHSNWIRREIPTHLSLRPLTYIWRGKPTSKKAKAAVEDLFASHYVPEKRPLRVLAINIDSLNTKDGVAIMERFLTEYKTMMVVDESTRIKTHTAKRTKACWKLGELAICRRILTGTPLTKSPSDLFSQFNFLKSGLLGTKSFRAFNAQYSVLLQPDDPRMIPIMRKLQGRAFGVPQIVEKDESGRPMFKNLDKLAEMIKPHSFRATKENYLDLPPKVYKVIPYELTKPQREIYNKLKEEYAYLLEKDDANEDLSFQAIAARTKLKQVTSGFINIYGEPVLLPPEDNPRLKAFEDYLDGLLETTSDRQFIVWAMFEQEILQIMAALEKRGIVAASYYGKTSKDERERIIDEFQAGSIQAFVGHAAAAGIGITLTAADLALYYSCSYDNELRKQSEDRCHRIGTTNSVLYVDFVAEDTLDEDVQRSLQMKSALADILIDGKSE